ncbi:Asp/Glu racemase [Aquabacter sp. L1I39]|uniref:aspartate/glutamate racemase family protein n=1 Tax=Aquabacter sp. L1I39 TaxID=2820278 RepID=UPI001ADBA7B7|nr:aspartate/glutamate racemase family protein [Aquabacter sp. L1I39]QTL05456.1 Asp/Glu racemase [Aquabacter sp. L1I39]
MTGTALQRLLIVNPNTSQAVTDLLEAAARPLLPSGVKLQAITAPFGAASLESPAETAIAAHAVLTALAEAEPFDAAIIGAFGDPGLEAAQDLFEAPIFGLGRASLQAAASYGRFVLVTVGPHLRPSLERAAHEAGVGDACAGMVFLPVSVLELATDPLAALPAIVAAAADFASQGTQAVLLAGAPFSGLADALAPSVRMPVLDGLTCALRAALAAAPARPEAPVAPLRKAMPGLSPRLAERIRRRLARPA